MIDDLAYFSLDPAGDIAIDGMLGGFFFKSTTDPASLSARDFKVEDIVLVDEDNDQVPDTAIQRPLGSARLIPEPGNVFLLATALALLALTRRSAYTRAASPLAITASAQRSAFAWLRGSRASNSAAARACPSRR